jgi:hypothetical protein
MLSFEIRRSVSRPQLSPCDLDRQMGRYRFGGTGANARVRGSHHGQVIGEACVLALAGWKRRPKGANSVGQLSQLVVRFNENDQSTRTILKSGKGDFNRQEVPRAGM